MLKRKREILEDYEANGNLQSKRTKRDTENSDVNDLVYRWFLDATSRMVNVSGHLLQERAKKFAKDLYYDDFKGGNGWLECF